MSEREAEIGIVGGGPAGAHLAFLLSSQGREVLLFDPKGAWEKPCGGGVTSRALREFSFLLENSSYPRRLVNRIKLVSPGRSVVRLAVEEPFAVYSRRVLNGLVLDRAIAAGAAFVRESVTSFQRDRDGWLVDSQLDGVKRTRRVRFLVGADGAASPTRRRLVGIFPKRDLALAFGYNITENGEPHHSELENGDEVLVGFPPDFTGYLWAFPRPGVMNFGVASKLGERTSEELRTVLTGFVSNYYEGKIPGSERATFFGAKIPTLDAKSWKNLQTTGDRWALAGDAAGFCDPITGEGIYYALKSAELLAEALGSTKDRRYETAATRYEQSWRAQFGRELERASQILPRFYRGYIFGQVFTDAMVRLSKVHRGTARILARALIGEQSYVSLKRDLLKSAWRIV
jgi:flavin-dependent dehydrogenase